MNGTYDQSSKLWLLQYACSHVIKIWLLGTLPTFINNAAYSPALDELPVLKLPSTCLAHLSLLTVLHTIAYSPLLPSPSQLTFGVFFLPLLAQDPGASEGRALEYTRKAGRAFSVERVEQAWPGKRQQDRGSGRSRVAWLMEPCLSLPAH